MSLPSRAVSHGCGDLGGQDSSHLAPATPSPRLGLSRRVRFTTLRQAIDLRFPAPFPVLPLAAVVVQWPVTFRLVKGRTTRLALIRQAAEMLSQRGGPRTSRVTRRRPTIACRECGNRGSERREWLASLDLPAISAEVICDALALIDALESVIDRLDLEVRQHARSDPRVKVLTQLPGVGPFTALVLLAEIGDIIRFASARKLASWAGLTPTVRGSDRTVRHGHISKQGSVWVRWILCEAAQKARHSPQFAASYQGIARRRGTKIATTAIARKLLTRACHLLTDASSAGAPS